MTFFPQLISFIFFFNISNFVIFPARFVMTFLFFFCFLFACGFVVTVEQSMRTIVVGLITVSIQLKGNKSQRRLKKGCYVETAFCGRKNVAATFPIFKRNLTSVILLVKVKGFLVMFCFDCFCYIINLSIKRLVCVIYFNYKHGFCVNV